MSSIKVVIICHLSNQMIRMNLKQRIPWYESICRKILKKNPPLLNDFAQWNTNAINELSKIPAVELFVISPSQYMAKKEQSFIIDKVRYFFFKDEDDVFIRKVFRALFPERFSCYYKNRERIKKYVDVINPDIIHIIGAENPYYSLSALDIKKGVPLIVQLQTLMSDPMFFENFSISKGEYDYRSSIEKKVILRADYLATKVKVFRDIIQRDIKPDVKFLDISLPVAEKVRYEESVKQFDFVYFASNISKACDLAVEAFGIAHQIHPEITLDIIGNYSESYKQYIDSIIDRYHLSDCVKFEGKLPSHDDVMSQIRKSRFALLPLKIDITSGTIRESMANGLPVITTITQGTPALNNGYQCALLSKVGDHKALANNICRLIEDKELGATLKNNGLKRAAARTSNAAIIAEWVNAYETILE